MDIVKKLEKIEKEIEIMKNECSNRWNNIERINEKNRRELIDVIYNAEENVENKIEWLHLSMMNEINMMELRNNRNQLDNLEIIDENRELYKDLMIQKKRLEKMEQDIEALK